MFVFSVCRLVSRRCHPISPIPAPLSLNPLLCWLCLLPSTRLPVAPSHNPSASKIRSGHSLSPSAVLYGLPPAAIFHTGSRQPVLWNGEGRPPRIVRASFRPRSPAQHPSSPARTRSLRTHQLGASAPLADWPSPERLIHGFVILQLGRLPQNLPDPVSRRRPIVLATPPKSDRRGPDLHRLDARPAGRTSAQACLRLVSRQLAAAPPKSEWSHDLQPREVTRETSRENVVPLIDPIRGGLSWGLRARRCQSPDWKNPPRRRRNEATV